jgi:hypothetical protein
VQTVESSYHERAKSDALKEVKQSTKDCQIDAGHTELSALARIAPILSSSLRPQQKMEPKKPAMGQAKKKHSQEKMTSIPFGSPHYRGFPNSQANVRPSECQFRSWQARSRKGYDLS